eukprot:TRINITY_DN11175_c0_g1_i1.p1 TRINITY_DN11175_c0_g1~~TRINITY_DN11175_c0_g1_i1.p1  ORF type:complete len:90 (-),score=16.73 TRINITY_DN11175_c0_g1_i1:72-302(-)
MASETSSMTDEVPNTIYSFESTSEKKAIASFLKWTSAENKQPELEVKDNVNSTDFETQHAAMQQQHTNDNNMTRQE